MSGACRSGAGLPCLFDLIEVALLSRACGLIVTSQQTRPSRTPSPAPGADCIFRTHLGSGVEINGFGRLIQRRPWDEATTRKEEALDRLRARHVSFGHHDRDYRSYRPPTRPTYEPASTVDLGVSSGHQPRLIFAITALRSNAGSPGAGVFYFTHPPEPDPHVHRPCLQRRS